MKAKAVLLKTLRTLRQFHDGTLFTRATGWRRVAVRADGMTVFERTLQSPSSKVRVVQTLVAPEGLGALGEIEKEVVLWH